MSHLPVTGKRLLALLLIILRIRIFAPPDGSLINFNSRVSIFHHHPPLGRGFLAVFRKLDFHYRLDGERTKCVTVSYAKHIRTALFLPVDLTVES